MCSYHWIISLNTDYTFWSQDIPSDHKITSLITRYPLWSNSLITDYLLWSQHVISDYRIYIFSAEILQNKRVSHLKTKLSLWSQNVVFDKMTTSTITEKNISDHIIFSVFTGYLYQLYFFSSIIQLNFMVEKYSFANNSYSSTLNVT